MRVCNAVFTIVFRAVVSPGHLPKGYARQKPAVPAVDRCESNVALPTPLCAPIATSLSGLVIFFELYRRLLSRAPNSMTVTVSE